ncbi:MAG: ribonuclease H-like domain-containing protein [Chloroflexota bacterium]|nr:ribonuclease H-like domain-containing protein [Chloroflexota bacterium]
MSAPLTLRERLGRVGGAQATIPAPTARPSTRPPGAKARPSFSVSEARYGLDDLDLEIVGRLEPDGSLLNHLGLRGEPPRRWEEVLFLDTETTGLAGGTGTYVFLLGLAWIEDRELVLRQHLLHDLGAEREFVGTLHTELERFRACASYNGKCFDLPLLRTRVTLALRAQLSVDDAHLDLLHPARRLWRDRFGSTSLRQLEESVLDDGRTDDIPGALIPERYFHYLATGDPALIAPVMRHNARDIVSLVRITDRVARAVLDARTGRTPDHPPAAFALARIFERSGESETAFLCYESAYVDGGTELRLRCALPFARALERRGQAERAVRLLETLLDLGLGSPRWRAQAEARVRRLSRSKRWQAVIAT